MPGSILIIEDDLQVRDLVQRYLERDGYRVYSSATGREGLALEVKEKPSLVLLDINLPDLDGWSILRRLRSNEQNPAVIMLTARSDEPDRLLGLDLGADDYIVKPFSPREVVARVKAVLRRLQPARVGSGELLQYDGLTVDLAGRTVRHDQHDVELTPKEFDLLVYLAQRPNRVISRTTLYDAVWGTEGQGDDHTLDVHINRLRKKLTNPDSSHNIRTIKGVGFKFEVAYAES